MGDMIWLALGSPLLCILVSMIYFRTPLYNPKTSPIKSVALIALFVPILLVGYGFLLGWGVNACVYLAIVSLGFCYSYFHLFNMSETARRIRMLRRIYLNGGSVAVKSLESEYSIEHIVKIRIQRLMDTGVLTRSQDGSIRVAKGALYYATQLIRFWRWLFFGSSM